MINKKIGVLLLFALLVSFGAKAQRATSMRINEVLVVNEDNFVDDYGKRHAWIELFNGSAGSVNIAGCFLLGLLSGFFTSHPAPVYRLFFTVGFCGSFTTFSTFSFENLQLLSNKAYGLFSLNIGLSLILGILFAGLGYLMTNK